MVDRIALGAWVEDFVVQQWEAAGSELLHLQGGVLMALARSFSIALVGLDGHVVLVEADLASGIPGLSMSGIETRAGRAPVGAGT